MPSTVADTAMAMNLRKKQLINWKIQGSIVARLMLYLCCYNVAILFLLVVAWGARASVAALSEAPTVNEPAAWSSQAVPLIGVMCLLLPFILWDLVRLTNRVAGPLYRFQSVMKHFVKTGTLPTATLRDGDLLTEFEINFNEFVEAVHALYPETNPKSGLNGAAVKSSAVAQNAILPSMTAKN